jgi:prepilin-type N-terminal cleavage/methylation domain-containing protein/prepilin-type processing-associated H-X9-DG protein
LKGGVFMRKRAFTLIELLVVIAIIALLLAIIVPSLKNAKVMAAGVVCMANESSAGKAWLSYAEDYKGNLMDGDQSSYADGKETYALAGGRNVTVLCFVAAPQDATGVVKKDTVEDEIRGFEKGALGPYMGKAWKAYNCPADKRSLNAPTAAAQYGALFGGYRTYSMTGVLSQKMAQPSVTTGEGKYVITKMSQFTNPSSKFTFLEEVDPRGINHKTWNLFLDQVRWFDPLAMLHNGASTFGYADGHAERYKWTGPVTRDWFDPSKQLQWQVGGCPSLIDRKDIDDFNWFLLHYIPGKR